MLLNALSFFFNDTATTEIYTLSLHDALPIYAEPEQQQGARQRQGAAGDQLRGQQEGRHPGPRWPGPRSEEHTSELQSRQYLVCRLLLEKKKEMLDQYGYSEAINCV